MLLSRDIHSNPDLTDTLISELRSHLDRNGVCLLKNAVGAEDLKALLRQVWSWGETQRPLPAEAKSFLQKNFKMPIRNYAAQNRISGTEEFSIYETPTEHVLYRLADLDGLSEQIPAANSVAKPLMRIHEALVGKDFPIRWQEGLKLNLEVVHYPVGGGFMEAHNHNHQHPAATLSFILALAKRGEDFEQGATCFRVGNQVLDTQNVHDQGDLLIFPSRMTHWVSACDPAAGRSPRYDSPKGRWTALLPLYVSDLGGPS